MTDQKRLAFARFLDLAWSDVNCDLHVHTSQTDGHGSIEELVSVAEQRGLARIAFTEHVRGDTSWFSEFVGQVRAAGQSVKELETFVGCEAKALDVQGTLDASETILAQCDVVLGSVHRFPDGRGGYLDFSTLPPDQFASIEFDLAMGLLRAGPINVLAHPGGMYAKHYGSFPTDLLRQILRKSLERSIAVEISTTYLSDLPAFLRLCAEINPFVSIGSDVHSPEQLGDCRDRLWKIMGRGYG